MAGIEAFLSLTVAALHLAVVPWCVRSDQLMPDAQLRGCFLKQCRQVTPAIGETVGEFKPIVSLNALYLYSSAGVPRPQLAQEIRRRIGGLLRISCQEFIDGGVLEQAQLRIRDTVAGNDFHIYLNALFWIGHLLIGLRAVRILRLFGRE